MAGDEMGDVIGDVGAVIFLTVRRALLSAPGGTAAGAQRDRDLVTELTATGLNECK